MQSVARVVALFGPYRGIARELERKLVIGRSAEAGLQLIDERVSREHCTIEESERLHVLNDLGSRNGTWVNGQRVNSPTPLRPGDEIAVGESVLVYEPSFEALRSRDGESTLVLTSAGTDRVRDGALPEGAVLAQAGELALRAAMAPSPEDAAELLCASFLRVFSPSSVAVVLRSADGSLRFSAGSPKGSHLSVGRPLLERALRVGKPLAMPQAQATAEVDEHTTRVHSRQGEVLCAPFIAWARPAGVVCAVRERPFEDAELALAGALAAAAGPASVRAPRSDEPAPLEMPVAASPAMREAMKTVQAAAAVPSTVLITGETGTGKEVLARTIHGLGSRAVGPFVAVNCGAIPAELAESELFGHEKGAFTGAGAARSGVFEQADSGTLFLDEVGDLPLALQVKLLRALQDRLVQRVGGRAPIPVDVRVLAATHRDLEAAMKSGAFREDLYWRLNVVRLHLPPLRERADDILPLAERLLSRLTARLGVRAEGFTPEAAQVLRACPWPGNARQLANAIERALVLKSDGGPIGTSDLPAEVIAPGPTATSAPPGRSLGDIVAAVEREQIVVALRRAKGTKVAAAEALGISRPTLDRKIAEYGIDLYQ
jgi:DNA-binding NtrC family response regulator/pSer/pThr/pTyr-binding forkhead associated (FHA) protein